MMAPGPKNSVNDLINAGQGLVRMLAVRLHRKFHSRLELDDLIAYGQLGLAQAAQNYDDATGNQFSTFAYFRIRGAIYDGIAQMSWSTRTDYRNAKVGARAGDLLEYHACHHALYNDETLLEEDADWFAAMAQQLVVVHLVAADPNAPEPMLGVADHRAPNPEAETELLELTGLVRKLVSQLPDESRQLIEAVYFEGTTLQTAAARLGVSKSWASRLHARILEQLAGELRGSC